MGKYPPQEPEKVVKAFTENQGLELDGFTKKVIGRIYSNELIAQRKLLDGDLTTAPV